MTRNKVQTARRGRLFISAMLFMLIAAGITLTATVPTANAANTADIQNARDYPELYARKYFDVNGLTDKYSSKYTFPDFSTMCAESAAKSLELTASLGSDGIYLQMPPNSLKVATEHLTDLLLFMRNGAGTVTMVRSYKWTMDDLGPIQPPQKMLMIQERRKDLEKLHKSGGSIAVTDSVPGQADVYEFFYVLVADEPNTGRRFLTSTISIVTVTIADKDPSTDTSDDGKKGGNGSDDGNANDNGGTPNGDGSKTPNGVANTPAVLEKWQSVQAFLVTYWWVFAVVGAGLAAVVVLKMVFGRG
jgi:hypothetical protein